MQGMQPKVCVCVLWNGLPCTDVCECRDFNNNKRDGENDCDDLVEEKEEEENIYYDSDYCDDWEFEYIYWYSSIFVIFLHLRIIFNHVQNIAYLSILRYLEIIEKLPLWRKPFWNHWKFIISTIKKKKS